MLLWLWLMKPRYVCGIHFRKAISPSSLFFILNIVKLRGFNDTRHSLCLNSRYIEQPLRAYYLMVIHFWSSHCVLNYSRWVLSPPKEQCCLSDFTSWILMEFSCWLFSRPLNGLTCTVLLKHIGKALYFMSVHFSPISITYHFICPRGEERMIHIDTQARHPLCWTLARGNTTVSEMSLFSAVNYYWPGGLVEKKSPILLCPKITHIQCNKRSQG